jgi:hypothetical protein
MLAPPFPHYPPPPRIPLPSAACPLPPPPMPTQSFANHTRWYPLYHYFASPLLIAFAGFAFANVWQEPTLERAAIALWSVGIVCALWASRGMAIRNQNRIIRLEMRIRFRELLPAPLAARSNALSIRQLVALRFAGDAELPGLVERTLNGEFAKPVDIKRAIRDWQGDYLRV